MSDMPLEEQVVKLPEPDSEPKVAQVNDVYATAPVDVEKGD